MNEVIKKENNNLILDDVKKISLGDLTVDFTQEEFEAFKNNYIIALSEAQMGQDIKINHKEFMIEVYKYFKAGLTFDKASKYLYFVPFSGKITIILTVAGIIKFLNFNLKNQDISIINYNAILLKKEEVKFDTNQMEFVLNCDIAKKMEKENTYAYSADYLDKNNQIDEQKYPFLFCWITFKNLKTNKVSSCLQIFKNSDLRFSVIKVVGADRFTNKNGVWQQRPFEMLRKTAIKQMLNLKAKIFLAIEYGAEVEYFYDDLYDKELNNNQTIKVNDIDKEPINHKSGVVNLDDF